MTGIRRVSDLGTNGAASIVDGSIQTADIASNAITQAKLSTDIPLSGFRNVLINGAMQIHQRVTSPSFPSGGGTYYYGADRWKTQDYIWSAGSNITVSNETTVVPTGFTNAYKWANGATGLTFSSGGNQHINQAIEGYNASALYGKTCSLSFWVRASTAGKYSIFFYNNAFTRGLVKTYTINNANTWEYKTMTIDMASAVSSGVWEKTTSAGLHVQFTLGTHADRTGNSNLDVWSPLPSYHYATSDSVNLATIANSTFYVTGVQLEAGPQATPFEQRSFGTELALCQRYFWKLLSTGISYLSFNYAGSQYRLTVPHPVQMRIAPHTITSLSWQGGSGAPTLSGNSVLGTNWVSTAGWFYIESSTSIEISAEL